MTTRVECRKRPKRPAGDSESKILADIRLALGREPDLCLWRLSAGGAVSRAGHTYRAGLSVNGAADLIGILTHRDLFINGEECPPVGRFFALEIKSEGGRVSADQQCWLSLVRARGGFAAVVRSVLEAKSALARARLGEYE